MAEDIGYDFVTGASISTTINSITDGNGTTSETAVDLGDPAPPMIGIRVDVVSAGAGGTGPVSWHIKWSDNNSDFSSSGTVEAVHVTTMNGVTAVDDVFAVPVQAQHFKLHMKNESGADMASSGNTAAYYEIWVDQA